MKKLIKNGLVITMDSKRNEKIEKLDIVMPIGISFYTFQILSYVIDVYWQKVKV